MVYIIVYDCMPWFTSVTSDTRILFHFGHNGCRDEQSWSLRSLKL